MIVHASAFVIYIIVAIAATLISFIVGAENDFYFHWLLCLVLGFISFLCLLFLLVHLGTKRKIPKPEHQEDREGT